MRHTQPQKENDYDHDEGSRRPGTRRETEIQELTVALQYARVLGARVIAVDVEGAKLDLARALGADLTVNARTTDPAQAPNMAAPTSRS